MNLYPPCNCRLRVVCLSLTVFNISASSFPLSVFPDNFSVPFLFYRIAVDAFPYIQLVHGHEEKVGLEFVDYNKSARKDYFMFDGS